MERSEFEELVAPHRAELHAHCYRLLGSVHDADDALQDALLGAWRGRDTFAGRSSLRAWLFRITTHACLHLIAQRPKRLLAADYQPAVQGTAIAAAVLEPIWIEPYPDDPHARFEQREQVELAFIAALQHLTASQRAVLLVRDVLGFSAEETAGLLEVTVATVTSALQRARASIAERVPARSQQATLRDLGEPAQRELVATFVSAWERADVDAMLALLASDARFTMPPIPTWFDGRDAIRRFLTERMFQTAWRLVPMRASGQLAFAAYQGPGFRIGALAVLTLRDRSIAEISGFLDPAVHARFHIPTDEFRRAADSIGDMKKTYTGSCHCGAIQYQVALDLAAGTSRCNCTFCAKSRFWLALAKADDFTLVRGAEALADYQHVPAGKSEPFLHLHFCRVCGVRPFTKGGHLPALGGEFYAIQVATLDAPPEELAAAPIRYVDGRNGDWNTAPAEHRHL